MKVTIRLNSKKLISDTEVTLMLPILDRYDEFISADEKFQTLWLLHGGQEIYSQYAEETNIYRLALEHKLAVVMPDTGTNHYNNVPGGGAYYDYLVEELPVLLRKYFPLSDKREDNFIAGASMGGFGAAKCAFNHPEKYGAVCIMSSGPQSAVQLRAQGQGAETPGFDRYTRIFGGVDKVPMSENDPWWVLKNQVDAGVELPLIFDCCGTDDHAYAAYAAFCEYAKELGVEVKTWEAPGVHDHIFWEKGLHEFIDWLPLLKNRGWRYEIKKQLGKVTPKENEDIPAQIATIRDAYFKNLK